MPEFLNMGVEMTLLLTCITNRFAVQASDRRLTLLDGSIHEEVANKATLFGNSAAFAFTGLARCSHVERTDELLMRCMAQEKPLPALLDTLAKTAASSIRNLQLACRPTERRSARRTSFVGGGFAGMRNPQAQGRLPSSDHLHPYLAVISNAQDLSEEWREEADQNFSVHLKFLPPDSLFMLHAAGQQLTGNERNQLERSIRRILEKTEGPEPIARVLARTIQAVSNRNARVGPNVMCAFAHRSRVFDNSIQLAGGLIPIVTEMQYEAEYFKRAPNGDPARWIYSPASPSAAIHYGPNYANSGIQIKGIRFGPPGADSD
ncbi:hypothetical protein [Kitasatospora sp. MBT63]|uniref:hypothetical protein n=1 Tax=Kitasatospora sp. MBT63 TaxID=1444768 RepID=UPI0011EA6F17|nr:hypothetical protein [Kitasatospora sp. MBT63]